MIGNEIQVGDFVVNATNCYGSGILRRSLITKLGPYDNKWNNAYYKDSHQLNTKSIIVEKQYINILKARTGNSKQLAKSKNDIVKFNVLKLYQDINAIFTPEELEIITKTKIKLK